MSEDEKSVTVGENGVPKTPIVEKKQTTLTKWIKKIRLKLGLTASGIATLVGTVYFTIVKPSQERYEVQVEACDFEKICEITSGNGEVGRAAPRKDSEAVTYLPEGTIVYGIYDGESTPYHDEKECTTYYYGKYAIKGKEGESIIIYLAERSRQDNDWKYVDYIRQAGNSRTTEVLHKKNVYDGEIENIPLNTEGVYIGDGKWTYLCDGDAIVVDSVNPETELKGDLSKYKEELAFQIKDHFSKWLKSQTSTEGGIPIQAESGQIIASDEENDR